MQDVAAYFDDVVAALGDVGVRTSSVEIDARQPLRGRLVVTEPGATRSRVLDWHRDTGWWCARARRLGARPSGWLIVIGDPQAAAVDVARQFRSHLLVPRNGE